jgi:dTDP-4-dehydrorhamnose reductase
MKIAITGARGRVMERLIRSMAPGTMAVLDLEDGDLDVRDLGKTMKSKDHRMLSQGV